MRRFGRWLLDTLADCAKEALTEFARVAGKRLAGWISMVLGRGYLRPPPIELPAVRSFLDLAAEHTTPDSEVFPALLEARAEFDAFEESQQEPAVGREV